MRETADGSLAIILGQRLADSSVRAIAAEEREKTATSRLHGWQDAAVFARNDLVALRAKTAKALELLGDLRDHTTRTEESDALLEEIRRVLL